jgi:hypothetical protein
MDEKVCCAEQLVDEVNPAMYRESSFQDFLEFLPSNINNYKRFVDASRSTELRRKTGSATPEHS